MLNYKTVIVLKLVQYLLILASSANYPAIFTRFRAITVNRRSVTLTVAFPSRFCSFCGSDFMGLRSSFANLASRLKNILQKFVS